MPDRSQKTEKPTPRKIKEAKRDGQVARTADLGAWAGMLIGVFLVRITVEKTVRLGQSLFAQANSMMTNPDPSLVTHFLSSAVLKGAEAVAPLAFGLLVTGVALSAAQGGVRFSAKSIKPKFDHLNPFKGLKRVFGVQGAWQAVKALGKTGILSFLLYGAIRSLLPLTNTGAVVPLGAVLATTGNVMFTFARNAAIGGLVMAAADYAYQLRRYRSNLKMSKEEIKEEFRNSEGDPQIKSAIKSRQMAMRRSRMMAAIAGADVVLVNPTHVAVALKYQAGRGAPKVVAKGAGAIAARIRAEAEKHRVPMVEDIPLARALYRVCELGQEIPNELFMAVARILAFVFSLRRKGSAAGVHHTVPTPEREVVGVRKWRGRRRRAPVAAARRSPVAAARARQ